MCRLIVVDDGSTDGTGDAVRAEFPGIEVLDGDGTLHYAGGTNRGIEAALRHDPDFIVTANDDAEFDPALFANLLSCADRNPGAVVGALLVRHEDPSVVFQVGLHFDVYYGGWHVPQRLARRRSPAGRPRGGDDRRQLPHGPDRAGPRRRADGRAPLPDRRGRRSVGAADAADRPAVCSRNRCARALPRQRRVALAAVARAGADRPNAAARHRPSTEPSTALAGCTPLRANAQHGDRRLRHALRSVVPTCAAHRDMATLARP